MQTLVSEWDYVSLSGPQPTKNGIKMMLKYILLKLEWQLTQVFEMVFDHKGGTNPWGSHSWEHMEDIPTLKIWLLSSIAQVYRI